MRRGYSPSQMERIRISLNPLRKLGNRREKKEKKLKKETESLVNESKLDGDVID
jgi:hypothetical protein